MPHVTGTRPQGEQSPQPWIEYRYLPLGKETLLSELDAAEGFGPGITRR